MRVFGPRPRFAEMVPLAEEYFSRKGAKTQSPIIKKGLMRLLGSGIRVSRDALNTSGRHGFK